MFAPLRQPIFRRIWIASLFSNFGTLIQGVGAAWAMTQLSGRADMVALVQSATFGAMMIVSLPAGAIADSYDRRTISLVALAIALFGAIGLSLIAVAGLLNPFLLLLFCVIVGTGTALFTPAWQASVGQQVPAAQLPQAIALNSISYNIARSFGPAIGGVLVAIFGVLGAFVFNAVAYLPMIGVMLLWRRPSEKTRLPPEALGRALISGVRYIIHSPPLRTVLLRTMLTGLLASSLFALMPLIARQVLHGGAGLYGALLGCFGLGAVFGAFVIGRLRVKLSDEQAVAACLAISGLAVIGVGFSTIVPLTCLLLFVAGAGWMIITAICNISIQLTSPRWVTARSLAIFSTAIFAGLAVGGWIWGRIASDHGTDIAMIVSGITITLSAALGPILRMPEIEEQRDRDTPLADVDVRLDLSGRSGPIIQIIEYRVRLDQARLFYAAMQDVQPIRHRNGGYGWSLSRDISDPELWIERYHTPTWHDHLRARSRLTAADIETWQRACAFHHGDEPIRIRRMLERPYGSVRRAEDIPDPGVLVPMPPPVS